MKRKIGVILLLLLNSLGSQSQNKPAARNLFEKEKNCNFWYVSKDAVITAGEIIKKPSLLGLGNNNSFNEFAKEHDKYGTTHTRIQQYYNGVAVNNAVLIIHEKEGHVYCINGNFYKIDNVNVNASLSEENALSSALAYLNADRYMWEDKTNEELIKQIYKDSSATFFPKGDLVILPLLRETDHYEYKLAYKFNIFSSVPNNNQEVYVDAANGQVLSSNSLMCHANGKAKTKYYGTQDIIAKTYGSAFILKDDQRGGGIQTKNARQIGNIGFVDNDNYWDNVNDDQDEIATDAHWATEKTFDYFKNTFGRNGFDPINNKTMVNAIHDNSVPNNSKWNGAYVQYGILGSGTDFITLDIVCHEWTHAYTEYLIGGITVAGESDAINEALSDIFATAIEFYLYDNGFDITPDWTMYEEVGAERSLSDPWEFKGAKLYNGINYTGEAHACSGLMSYWYYLLCQGKNDENEMGDKYSIEPIGMEKATQIVYKAYGYMTNMSNFTDVREATILAAKDLFPGGDCSKEVIQVQNAWYAVGVGNSALMIEKIETDQTVCGNPPSGSAEAFVIGSSNPQYEWDSSPIQTTAKAVNLEGKTYTVKVTDPASGCTVERSVTIDDAGKPKVEIKTSPVSNCSASNGKAEAIVNGYNGTLSYSWNFGSFQPSNKVSNLPAGNHVVLVKNNTTGCTTSKNFVIGYLGNNAKISGGGERWLCPQMNSATMHASVTPPCANCTYRWFASSDTTSPVISTADEYASATSGDFSLAVTNPAGNCISVAKTKLKITRKKCDGSDNNPSGKNGPGATIPIRVSKDPNEITGPSGFDARQWVSVKDELFYHVDFENDPEFATAPVTKLSVIIPLDPKMNLYSFKLSDFGFGNLSFSVPQNSSFYSKRLDLTDSLGIFVDVDAGVDVVNNTMFWLFQSIDPTTGLPTTDPAKGFLAVNDTISHKGEGYVNFSIKPKISALTGDTIHAQASIVFDLNAPVITNTWFNIVDAFAPVSEIDSVYYNLQDSTTISLLWHGSDDAGGCGVKDFDLYVSENQAPYYLHTAGINDTFISIDGNPGSSYCFYTIAFDQVKNREADKPGCNDSLSLPPQNVPPQILISRIPYNTYNMNACIGLLTELCLQTEDLNNDSVSVDIVKPASTGITSLVSDSSGICINYQNSGTGGADTIIISACDITGLCDTLMLFLNAATPPSATASAIGPVALCEGDSVLLSGSVIAGTTMQWRKGNLNIPGATDSIYFAKETGNYYLIASNSCSADTSAVITITVKSKPNAYILAASYTFCANDSVFLEAPNGDSCTYQWLVNGINISGAADSSLYALSGGSYSVIEQNSCGIDTSVSLQITQFPGAVVPVISQISDTLYSTQAISYQWYLNGIPINGAVSQLYFSATPGSYTVVVTDSNGCIATSAPFIVSGIQEFGNGTTVEVYPNPNEGEFTLIINSVKNSVYRIEVFNILSQCIVSEELYFRIGMNQKPMHLNHLAPGIYVIRILSADLTVDNKILIH